MLTHQRMRVLKKCAARACDVGEGSPGDEMRKTINAKGGKGGATVGKKTTSQNASPSKIYSMSTKNVVISLAVATH